MNPKQKGTAEGLILGIIGFILFLDFMAIDASLFGFNPPQWIITMSSYFQVSPLMIDILTTVALILIISMLHTEREIGEWERKR